MGFIPIQRRTQSILFVAVVAATCSTRMYSNSWSFQTNTPKSERRNTIFVLKSNEHFHYPQRHSTRWSLPNCFETFLNQCSIQSFMFVAKSLRDPQTVLWIENFTQPALSVVEGPSYTEHMRSGSQGSRLLTYHGLAAMNTTLFETWDVYFRKLLEEPAVTFTVEADSPYIPNYDVEINPVSLCARILSVREQISKEFVRDLDVIASMGGKTLEDYWESLKDNEERNRLELPTNVFLGINPDPESDLKPSPLRRGNFDLLTLMATQEAVHRLLNDDERQSGDEQHTNQYLEEFYVKRLSSHFSGIQRYNRADDFIQELLDTSPSLKSVGNDDSQEAVTALMDPTRLAELILHRREMVANEWKEIAEKAGEAHLQLKRIQLNVLMGIPIRAEGDDSADSTGRVEENNHHDHDDGFFELPPLS